MYRLLVLVSSLSLVLAWGGEQSAQAFVNVDATTFFDAACAGPHTVTEDTRVSGFYDADGENCNVSVASGVELQLVDVDLEDVVDLDICSSTAVGRLLIRRTDIMVSNDIDIGCGYEGAVQINDSLLDAENVLSITLTGPRNSLNVRESDLIGKETVILTTSGENAPIVIQNSRVESEEGDSSDEGVLIETFGQRSGVTTRNSMLLVPLRGADVDIETNASRSPIRAIGSNMEGENVRLTSEADFSQIVVSRTDIDTDSDANARTKGVRSPISIVNSIIDGEFAPNITSEGDHSRIIVRNSTITSVGPVQVESSGANSPVTINNGTLESEVNGVEVRTTGPNSSIVARNSDLDGDSDEDLIVETTAADSNITAVGNTFSTPDDVDIMGAGKTRAKENDFTGVFGATEISGAVACTSIDNVPDTPCL